MKRLFAALAVLSVLALPPLLAAKKGKNPTVEESPDGKRTVVLPDDIDLFLSVEFPKYRLPDESEFDPEMLQYYNSRLIGVYPAVAYGDFNGDKKRDYALLVITGDTKWGPLCELVVANGTKGGYEAFRLGEVYEFKNDYVSFVDNKLIKGRYKKNGWYINWDPKKNTYNVLKS
jgi:hypothetical protein